MKFSLLPLVCASVALVSSAPGGLIYWVADHGPEGEFSAPVAGPPDSGYIDLLVAAGHSVTRYNPPTEGLVPQGDIDILNTADLIILGRAFVSTPLQNTGVNVQAPQWNTSITAPLICTSAYGVRSSRLGWFTGATLEDAPGTRIIVADLTEARTAYLFEGVAFDGLTMENDYNTQIDRGTSQISQPPVTGGEILATVSFAPTDGAPATFIGNQIVSFPAETPMRGGADLSGGYRLYFAAGSRELDGQAATAAGQMDLTANGQTIFLRAVLLAMNSGSVPVTTGPELSITVANGQMILTWDDPEWVLVQSGTMVEGSWEFSAGGSPFSVPLTGPPQFFRLHYLP